MNSRNDNYSAYEVRVEVGTAPVPGWEKVTWYRDRGLRSLYFWAGILCVASATTGYDGMLLNASQIIDKWQEFFDYPKDSKLGLMSALFMIGSISSFPLVPILADRFGRKIPIAVGCALMIVGGSLGTFCNGYGMYIGGRVLLGFGNSLAQMSSPVLLTEICHPQHRARITTIYNCLWNLGALIVSWLALATVRIPNDWAWRTLTLLQIIPSAFQLLFIYWVPESPRWLVAKGRYDDALHILAKYHANGDANNPTVQFEFHEIKETLRLEVEFNKNSSYLDFFRTKGNRYRLLLIASLAIISQYSGNALFSNYMNLMYEGMGITDQNIKIPLSGGQMLLNLLVSLSSAFLVDRVGRRPLFLVATTGMLFMFIALTITGAMYERDLSNAPVGYLQVIFIWLYGVFYSLAWSGLLVAYTLEILPYKLRAKGLMIMNFIVQGALVLGNQTNPIAWERLPNHWMLSMIYAIWIFFELIFVYFFYVETRGPTLEELAKIFDGDEGVVGYMDIDKMGENYPMQSPEGVRKRR
ncbi:hypothetical protein AJ80_07402 [Polytolypa hystricis UAMH7299]|uniref:Major facilitator superfamily (MFS) profile domain-containing protein n=1 Tax=Polytolypa hystricis (strain UAMH7299) TaxID=1447883 RepID=A0A2B7XQ31_POLH7|nr:hypothetical protein AJ80_07402 [Polytolypa hystricis UAMH7299]